MNFFKSFLSKQSAILSYCPTPALIVSEDGEILFANDDARQLLETANLVSLNISDIFGTRASSLFSKESPKTLLKIKVSDSEEKVIEISAKKLPDEPKFVVTIHDITKSHSMIQTLLDEQTNKEKENHQKNNLLAKMSNNLKSPLHSIIGFSQAILEGLGGEINDKQEKYLKIIHKNSSELLFLIEKIVELSEIEANLYEYSYKSFDVLNTLNNSMNEFKAKIEEKRLQLNVDTEQLIRKTAYSDENVVKNVLNNLLENAVTSCDIGSITIKLSNPSLELVKEKTLTIHPCADEKSFLMVEVIDTGAGITSNELPEIFDPYVQADKNIKKNLIKGLILGISQKFINNLHGTIWVESEIMKESRYSFILPTERFAEETIIKEIPTGDIPEEIEEV